MPSLRELRIGIVLAGGASRRMGVDKALLRWRGATFVERAVATLRPWVGKVVVVQGDRTLPPLHGATRYREPDPGGGPLPALAAAFQEFPAPQWLVVPCDLPLLEAHHLAPLLEAAGCDPDSAGACFERDGRLEPLVALHTRVSAAALLEQARRNPRGPVHEALSGMRRVAIEAARRPSFRNVNAPQDLADLEALEIAPLPGGRP